MRITGGKARGISLQSPKKGDIRPATDYLREAVFASLGAAVEGARVLDCFAGTGAYALEAMSRGAAAATLVELSAEAVRAIGRNAEAVAKSAGFDVGASLRVQQADVLAWLRRQTPQAGSYTLAFIDPPYPLWQKDPMALLGPALPLLGGAEGLPLRLVLEAPGNWSPPQLEGLTLLRHLKKGPHQPSALIYAPQTQAEA